VKATLKRPTLPEAERIIEAARKTPFSEQTDKQRALHNLAREVVGEETDKQLRLINLAKSFECGLCQRPASLHRNYQFEGGCAGFQPRPAEAESYWAFILLLPDGFEHTPYSPPAGEREEDFWPYPVLVDMAEETVPRREAITARVMQFIWASRARSAELEANWRFGPRSYRRVLAARALSDAVESYAVKWRGPLSGHPEEELERRVKEAAKEYVAAHHELPGRFRGQVEMDYPEYARYCRTFGLKEGHILHEEPGRKVAA
jgi:hypothetical protein